MGRGHEREDVDRVARLYSSNAAAAGALGVTPRSFARLCRQYGIETPYARKRRRAAEARRPVAEPGVLILRGTEASWPQPGRTSI